GGGSGRRERGVSKERPIGVMALVLSSLAGLGERRARGLWGNDPDRVSKRGGRELRADGTAAGLHGVGSSAAGRHGCAPGIMDRQISGGFPPWHSQRHRPSAASSEPLAVLPASTAALPAKDPA